VNILRLRKFNLINWSLWSLLLGAAFLCGPQAAVTAQVIGPLPSYNPFFVRNYGGKCLDFGPPPQASGAPVFIYDCNGTTAQRVVPVEIDPRLTSRHAVLLFAGNNKVIGVRGNALIEQAPLELQDYNGSAGQIFELDGDSVILAADRNLVVESQRARGANWTPLVLGARDLADGEFWEFISSDGSNRRPTRGFVRISQVDNFDNGGELQARLDFLDAVRNARWGTVIELDPNVSIDLTDTAPLLILAGVTIRGDRRGVRLGPELRTSRANLWMLEIAGNEVRITGLRMRGPTRDLAGMDREDKGIFARSKYTSIIDHNDISDWPWAAVYVDGESILADQAHPIHRPENVRVARNFIHHNRQNSFGYGVALKFAGYALIEGNTFLQNRHAITGDGRERTSYRAWFNLMLHEAPDYGSGIQQDFDMHGTGDAGCTHCGGIAGEYIEIARNTFLGTGRANFDLRGTPTYLAEFHHNVLVQALTGLPFPIVNRGDPAKLIVSDNQFSAPNPTKRLGVGDFDGDGAQDLFLATGAAWYYAPLGKAEWRYLNAQTDGISDLLFGDFDADGRTDVFTQHGSNWDVSWGGESRWENINVSGAILGNAAIGDFIGDERDDVFYADGQTWYISDGGAGQFVALRPSNFRVADLRFGDFNADGKTEVFGVVSGYWQVSYGGASDWQPLRPKLSDSVTNLTVADFNGDGRADVATSTGSVLTGWIWKVSYSGAGNWTSLRASGAPLASAAAIGRFNSGEGADVLLWHDNYLDIAPSGAGNSSRYSRQDMR
jgi:FG-GAP-like repeat